MEFNLAEIHEAIAAAIPERTSIVYRERALSWAEVTDRTRRLANYLRSRGLGLTSTRRDLSSWESGQDHVALYLYNCNEYLEGMLGAFKSRTAPFNVNYRYVEEELIYLLRDARARAIVYHASFAPTLEKIRPELPDLEVLLQVADASGEALLPGATDYEQALASASPERPDLEWSPDDLYILYTGGTTGMPKGVLWRQADIFIAALGGRAPDGSEPASLDAIVERAMKSTASIMPTPPLMHGAAHWAAFNAFHGGQKIVMQSQNDRLDTHDVLSTLEAHKVLAVLIVGDAFARPLLDQLRKQSYDLGATRVLVTGGAALNASLKEEFLELLPHLTIIDSVGSSETGSQGQNVSTRETGASTGTFSPSPFSCVLSADLDRVLEPDHEGLGWFAQRGRVPLGYLRDEAKTARTFPEVDGVRYSVTGDRARLREDGIVELLGRDSVTINSGGEKIFAEEVEHALKQHAGVYDAVVCGRPSERWGQEVVAVVRLREGVEASDADLLAECGRHIARYKFPKAFIYVDEIVRSPSGKADYRWAAEMAAG
ncbi:MAG: acyl-CoA synthetase [Myxococcota bacterium]|nr:acyl-CoA synthetase [Myxococcota bacterium]